MSMKKKRKPEHEKLKRRRGLQESERNLKKAKVLTYGNFGVDYGFELAESWELSINLQNDSKVNSYDSWLFGLGVSKSF